MLNDIEFAELLCARFCHDLSGPIGAVNNGIEFLEDSNAEMQEQALDLISNSIHQALARLQFYRMAFGNINGTQPSNLDQLRHLIKQFLDQTNASLEWNEHTSNGNLILPQSSAKLLLNMILIVDSCLIHAGNVSLRHQQSDLGKRMNIKGHGGKIVVNITPENSHINLNVSGEGKKIKCSEELVAILSGNMNDCDHTSQNIQHFLTHQLAANLGANLELEFDDTSCQLATSYS